MSEQGWFLIVNPAAGHGVATRLHEMVLKRLQAAGRCVECFFTEGPGDACRQAERARESGAAAVIAVGGDGTVHEVLNGLGRGGLDGLGVSLGIVPVGTGNSFLRDFGIAANVEEALARILGGRTRPVDVAQFRYTEGGTVRSGLFLNILGIGFMADVCRLANRYFKRLGPLGYTLAALQALHSLRSRPGRVVADGREHSGPLSLLALCNSQYTGGNMWIAPMASMEDGRLDLVLLESGGKWRLLRSLVRVYRGRHLEVPGVSHSRARVVEVDCEQPLPLMPDGEVYGTTPVRVEVRPGALRLLI